VKKRFIFMILIAIALLLAFFVKRCVTGSLVPVQQKKPSISPESILPGRNLKKSMNETAGAGVKDYDMLFVRLDREGKTKWVKTYGTAEYDWADFIIQGDDGGFIALARTYYAEDGTDSYYVIKLDASGNSLWSKTFAGKNETTMEPVAQAAGGGYIIAGKTFSGGSEEKEVFLAKTDKDGNYEWVHNFGREYYDWGYSAVIDTDGSYIIVGQDEVPGDNADFYLRKRGNTGKYIWEKSYGGRDFDWAYSIAPAAGGYMLAGLTYSYGNGNDDIYLVKVDGAGEHVWDRTYGGPGYDEAFSICADDETGFVMAGATTSAGNGGHDVYVLKVDADGNSIWSSVIGGAGNEAAYCVNRLKDGGYIIAGATNSVWNK
jgi:hypothetical protein